MPRGLPALLVLTSFLSVLVAGCVGPAGPDPDDDADAPLPVASRTVLWPDCFCFEPSVAVAPDGTLYATRGSGTQFLVREPGAQAEIRVAPMPPWSGTATGLPGDSLVQTDPAGRLYYHTLLYQGGVFGPLLLLGVQVAISEDGGKTWPVNRFFGFPDDTSLPQLGADRQWLLVSPEGDLHLVYQRHANSVYAVPRQTQEAAVMHARSLDGGATWSDFAPISMPASVVINGQPAVTSDGRLVIPYFGYGETRALHVAVSDDGGARFRSHQVWTGTDGPGALFPSVAAARNGTLILAWSGPDDALLVAASDDGGQTWSEPVRWSGADEIVGSPWALVHGDQVYVLWFKASPEGGARLHGSAAPLSDLTRRVDQALETGDGAAPAPNTDFAYGVVDGSGLLHAVRADPEARQMFLYTRPLEASG